MAPQAGSAEQRLRRPPRLQLCVRQPSRRFLPGARRGRNRRLFYTKAAGHAAMQRPAAWPTETLPPPSPPPRTLPAAPAACDLGAENRGTEAKAETGFGSFSPRIRCPAVSEQQLLHPVRLPVHSAPSSTECTKLKGDRVGWRERVTRHSASKFNLVVVVVDDCTVTCVSASLAQLNHHSVGPLAQQLGPTQCRRLLSRCARS